MIISPLGMDFIKDFEGYEPKAYKPVEGDKYTIGYGSTSYSSNGIRVPVYQGMEITRLEAEQMFEDDLNWVQGCLNSSVFITILQYQFDALCSLVFNIGRPTWMVSTARKDLNLRDFKGFGEQAFSQEYGWVHFQGKVLPGLVKRRTMEADLFFNGNYGVSA